MIGKGTAKRQDAASTLRPKMHTISQSHVLSITPGLGRAADYSTALLQTRASAINAYGSSDYGFAGSSFHPVFAMLNCFAVTVS